MRSEINIHKGLAGVIADTSKISKVNPELNSLVYRGYPVQDLAVHCSFEDIAYLLLFGDLPDKRQSDEFKKNERSKRIRISLLKECLPKNCKEAHPMDTLRTCISYLGSKSGHFSEESIEDRSIRLIASIPTIIASIIRTRQNKEICESSQGHSICENFFLQSFGSLPSESVIRAFEASMILYAEHGFNASTFTARVIMSTESDIYSAVCGAIGALKGPLHGGANEAVMKMLKDIETPDRAKPWLDHALKNRKKIMGFGHRVYRNGDSRVPCMRYFTKQLSRDSGISVWSDISDILEAEMIRQKNIYPNLDFPAGPAYHLMGFETDLFTPLFVMARITGWCAHIAEQKSDNRIIRPLCHYNGIQKRQLADHVNKKI